MKTNKVTNKGQRGRQQGQSHKCRETRDAERKQEIDLSNSEMVTNIGTGRQRKNEEEKTRIRSANMNRGSRLTTRTWQGEEVGHMRSRELHICMWVLEIVEQDGCRRKTLASMLWLSRE